VFEGQLPALRLDLQRALGIELQLLRTLEAHADGRRFGAGGEDEVVFQCPWLP